MTCGPLSRKQARVTQTEKQERIGLSWFKISRRLKNWACYAEGSRQQPHNTIAIVRHGICGRSVDHDGVMIQEIKVW